MSEPASQAMTVAHPHISNRIKGIDRARHILQKRVELLENALPSKGLVISKEYVEGRLWIALRFNRAGIGQNEGEVWVFIGNLEGNAFYTRAGGPAFLVEDFHSLNAKNPIDRDKHNVLVGDVEAMKLIESQLPAFVWLYLVKNARDHLCGRQGSLFLSVDGTYKRVPVFSERKARVGVDEPAVIFDAGTIRVIQGDSEIMNCVSDDSWNMLWQRYAHTSGGNFPATTLVLTPHSLHVFRYVSPKDEFELADVMFGPFDL